MTLPSLARAGGWTVKNTAPFGVAAEGLPRSPKRAGSAAMAACWGLPWRSRSTSHTGRVARPAA